MGLNIFVGCLAAFVVGICGWLWWIENRKD